MAKAVFLLGSLLLLVSSACAFNFTYNPLSHFIYVGCALDQYPPNTSYAQTLDHVLVSINNSAPHQTYNSFNISSSNKTEVISALYQCRGDISMPDCTICVQEAVNELRQMCFKFFSGSIQMEGCSVKYDNSTFIGQQDTGLELRKCGPRPRLSYKDADHLRLQRDMVLEGLLKLEAEQSYLYRANKADNIQSMAQCMGDLNQAQCQECVAEAVRMTKQECATEFTYGDIFLGKCYVRYTIDPIQPKSGGISRTAKLIIVIALGLFAAVVLLCTLQAFLRLVSAKGNGKQASQVSLAPTKATS